jgi:hypothetical protein
MGTTIATIYSFAAKPGLKERKKPWRFGECRTSPSLNSTALPGAAPESTAMS